MTSNPAPGKAPYARGLVAGLFFILAACAPLAGEQPRSDQASPAGPGRPASASPTLRPVRASPSARASAPASASPEVVKSPTAAGTPPPLPSPIPLPSPTPLECWAEGGRYEFHSLYTDLSDWPWDLRIYLPPCYDEQPERRYPTLYLIHGSTFNDDQWDRLGADETADRLIARGEIPPFLIVMPRDRVWTEPDEDPFGQAVADHILPWVDSRYRTLADREHRAVGGLSRGAAWAVHLGLSRWELFGAIGAHSLPVFWSDTRHIRLWIAEIPAGQTPRIYLDIGEQDYLIRSARWFEHLLTELGVAHEWYLFPGVHEEDYWRAHLEAYLRWYAREW